MSGVDIKLEGFDRLIEALKTPRAKMLLRQNVGAQMRLAAQKLRAAVVRYIDSEAHGLPNSPLTILAKGSSRPLVDRGDLRQSIEATYHETPGQLVGGVGVARSASGKNGHVNVAAVLHEGTVITVTDKVRKAVFASIRDRRGQSVRHEGGGRKIWRIRGRPFVRVPFELQLNDIKTMILDGVRRTIEKL